MQTTLKFTEIEPQATGEYVFIRPLPQMTKSLGGIIIPDTASPDEVRGLVMGVGRGRALLERDGQVTMVKPEAQVGDVVIFRPLGGYRVLYNDVDHWIVPDNQVLLKIGFVESLRPTAKQKIFGTENQPARQACDAIDS